MITVNKPLANTFGWLHGNGTQIEAPASTEEITLTAAAGEERIVALPDSPSARITVSVAENAVLRLIQVRRGGDGGVCDIHVDCAENAHFEWYRVVLGGAASYDNCSVTLRGDGSSFLTELGFRLGGDERYDVNCEAIHLGKKTRSDIHAAGVLRDRAFKILRGTIDLRRGCAGSVGSEMEDVLLMDETVRNQSIPVILCGEEDVEGNHGATIGRLDEELVYYLASRGVSREQVYEIMAQAKLNAVISRIPDEETRLLLTENGAEGETI